MEKCFFWRVTDGEKWMLVGCTEKMDSVYLCTCTYYVDRHLLHINTVESNSQRKGVGRSLLSESLAWMLEFLGYPTIYLFSCPAYSFYLSCENTLIHPDVLKRYWKEILNGMKYTVECIGYQEIRREEAYGILLRYPEVLSSFSLLEDDPVSRVLQKKNVSVPEALSILSNSKDLTTGSLMVGSRNQEEKALFEQKTENLLESSNISKNKHNLVSTKEFLHTLSSLKKKEFSFASLGHPHNISLVAPYVRQEKEETPRRITIKKK
ncbi:hypothetical protein NEFER03_0227 [Nematocida sp. LUAm3]|nr:hypothetical protein NEFER03_0227 [Nematocida sp. LUAm3]KAI5173680.1 hypothetical protein NEFER02_0196 [Nematocida sp. LUAm2]KAI5176901.1 hypothetical protein NEFER01_0226 [Nematocida sp. LUAm1]